MTHTARTSWTPVTPDPPVDAILWSYDQASARLGGIGRRTLERLVASKRIPYRRLQGRVFFVPEELAQWARQLHGSGTEEEVRDGQSGEAR